jgi:hypothetical protein
MNTIDVLDGKALVLGADLRFTISVDGDPANGRTNHIRSSPAAHELYIRDVLLDWERDRVNELAVVRLSPPPPRAPRRRGWVWQNADSRTRRESSIFHLRSTVRRAV